MISNNLDLSMQTGNFAVRRQELNLLEGHEDDNKVLMDYPDLGENFILSRVNFYLAGSTLVNYPFIQRVFKTSFQILKAV